MLAAKKNNLIDLVGVGGEPHNDEARAQGAAAAAPVLRDVELARIKGAVATLARFYLDSPRKPVEDRSLEGSLTQLSLPDVLQMLSTLKKTGALIFTHERHSAILVLKDGRIVGCRDLDEQEATDARLTGPEFMRKAVSTVLTLLSWNSGRFLFESEDTGSAERFQRDIGISHGSVALEPTEVLLTAIRSMDEDNARARSASFADAEVRDATSGARQHGPMASYAYNPFRRRRRWALRLGSAAHRLADALRQLHTRLVASPRTPIQRSLAALIVGTETLLAKCARSLTRAARALRQAFAPRAVRLLHSPYLKTVAVWSAIALIVLTVVLHISAHPPAQLVRDNAAAMPKAGALPAAATRARQATTITAAADRRKTAKQSTPRPTGHASSPTNE